MELPLFTGIARPTGESPFKGFDHSHSGMQDGRQTGIPSNQPVA
jgi:hypothetical protein